MPLGVVLLEIGLWELAIKPEKNVFAHARDNYAIQPQLIKHANKRLDGCSRHRNQSKRRFSSTGNLPGPVCPVVLFGALRLCLGATIDISISSWYDTS